MRRNLVMRNIGGGLGLFALAGCLALPEDTADTPPPTGEGLFAILSTTSRPPGDPLPQAPIAGGDILITGPEGYCVDARSLRNRASGGFALLASCYVMSGGTDGLPVTPVIMTVSAAPEDKLHGVPDADSMAEAFDPAKVLTSRNVQGVTLLQLDQGGDATLKDADPKHWRGALALNGYIVGLAVYGPKGSYTSEEGGGALVIELAQTLRAADRRHKAALAAARRDAVSPPPRQRTTSRKVAEMPRPAGMAVCLVASFSKAF
ncbi:hypothetical protein [Pseudooceanicola sp.]|uniref:hypothetical protein n=1 Tax=Pseudooceanicola sp. TaxID=1914328 RepID=UPI00261FC02D|nr:hypothetical protein [Pseudooceanicola sp.]MDF1857228.1 hypothetical protein [Pseudooceanicola sp.]